MVKISGGDSGYFRKNRVEESGKSGKTDRAAPASESGKAGSGPQSVDAKIAVSDLGKEVARIHEELKKTPEVRDEKVQELREKIDDGTYYVSSDRIAEKVLRDIISPS